MIEKNEINIEVLERSNSNSDDSEESVCPITLTPISKLEDPVVTRDSGHIYERAALIQWIVSRGTDPMTKQPLTLEMLASGRHIKRIVIESKEKNKETNNKIAKLEEERLKDKQEILEIKERFNRLEGMFNTLYAKNEKNEKEIATLREENKKFRADNERLTLKVESLEIENKKLREDNERLNQKVATLEEDKKVLTQKVESLEKKYKQDIESLQKKYSDSQDKINGLQNQVDTLTAEKNSLAEEKNLMKESCINEEWYLYGSKIDNKIKKGCSTDYKQKALTTFAHSYKKSYKQEDINNALEQGKKFQSDPSLRQRYGLFPTFGQSESSKLVGEFINNVNQENKPLI